MTQPPVPQQAAHPPTHPPTLHAVGPVAPGGGDPAPVSLLAKHWPTLAKGAGFIVTATVAWTAIGNRVERLEEQTSSISSDVASMKRETSARFEDLNKQREQHARDIALLNARLESLKESVQRTEQNTLLVLDRLGRPSPRR